MDVIVIRDLEVPGWNGDFDEEGRPCVELIRGSDLMEALAAAYSTDAMFQPLRVDDETFWSRLNKGGVRALVDAGELVELTWAVLDYDTKAGPDEPVGHWPWKSEGQANGVRDRLISALQEATGSKPTSYITRKGVRVMWPLPMPVPIEAATSFLTQLHGTIRHLDIECVELDESCKQWWRVYRLPHSKRAGVDDVPPDLDYGEPLAWFPETVEMEEIKASSSAEATEGPPHRKLTTDEWKHIPRTWRADLKAGKALFQEGEGPGRNAGILSVILPRVCATMARLEVPDPELIYQAFYSTVEAQGEPSLDRLWQRINDFVHNDVEEFSRERYLNQKVMGAAYAMPTEKVDELREKLVPANDMVKTKLKATRTKSEPMLIYTGESRTAFVHYPREGLYRAKAKDVIAVVMEKTHGVTLRTPKDNPMTFPDVFDAVGVDAHSLVLNYWTPGSKEWYDPKTKTLHKTTPRPAGDLKPIYHADVAEWLALLPEDPAMHPRLLDWISQVINVTRPMAALVLQGSAGVGKGLLALGLGAIWGKAGIYDDNVGKTYTPDLPNSPFLWGDEGLRAETENVVEAFKSLITQPEHTLSVKWGAHCVARGYARVLIAANKLDDIQIPSDITAESLEALEERLLFVKTSPAARGFFNNRDTFTEGWVVQDGTLVPGKIAEHALWLSENHELSRPAGRLVVAGDVGGAWRKARVMKSSGLDGSILMALASWADKARPMEGLYAQDVEGTTAVLVSASHLHEAWRELTRDHTPPRLRTLAASISLLSMWGKSRSLKMGREKRRYHAIPVDLILATAEDCGIGDDDALKDFFRKQAGIRGPIETNPGNRAPVGG